MEEKNMADNPQQSLKATPEQLLYAKILEVGMYIGLAILLVTYFIYVLGIMAPYIPLNEVPNYWTMTVTDYLHEADIHAGWSWVGMVHKGDFLNFIGIAILAGVTIICFLSIVPTLWANNDRVYAVLAVVEVIILTVAASGILAVGGH
jgi:hypothetical protein